MALGPRLELRQSQALVMTPQLQQAIKLLQMSNLELKDYVEQELEENPLLERDEEEHRDRDECTDKHGSVLQYASHSNTQVTPAGKDSHNRQAAPQLLPAPAIPPRISTLPALPDLLRRSSACDSPRPPSDRSAAS